MFTLSFRVLLCTLSFYAVSSWLVEIFTLDRAGVGCLCECFYQFWACRTTRGTILYYVDVRFCVADLLFRPWEFV